MMRRCLLHWAAALALLSSAAVAADAPYAPLQQEELYLSAMRALADDHPEQAAELLTRFLQHEPQHAGAWLDLAISQCELGHAAEAERLFREIEQRFNPPPGIVEVIQQHRASGCPAPYLRRPQFAVTLGRGHDDNVNQGASSSTFTTGSGSNLAQWDLAPEYLPQPDYYSLLSADYVQPLDSQGSVVIAQLRSRRNDTVHDQDSNSLLLGLDRPWQWGRWRAHGTVALGLVQLNKQLYQRQGQLQLRVAPPVSLPEHLDWNLTSGLSHVIYPTRDHYDATTLELGSTLDYHSSKRQSQAALGLLADHGDQERPGGDRHGWYAGLQSSAQLAPYLSGEVAWNHQAWRSQQTYSPGLIDVARRQDTDQLRVTLLVPLQLHQTLQLEWRATRNQENISLFQYNSRQLQLSWRWDNF